jgi:hypothetical protein
VFASLIEVAEEFVHDFDVFFVSATAGPIKQDRVQFIEEDDCTTSLLGECSCFAEQRVHACA